jgi:hypothetical protein
MKIYIVEVDALNGKLMTDVTNEELETMYNDGNEYVTRYDSATELAAYWNNDELVNPCNSYMRVVDEELDAE